MLRKSKHSDTSAAYTINPANLTPDEAMMLIQLYKLQQDKQPEKSLTLTLKPSGRIRKHQYPLDVPSTVTANTTLSLILEVTHKIILHPICQISPAHPSDEEKRLLKFLINSYPDDHTLSAYDPVTHIPNIYLVSVPSPKDSKVFHFSLVRLTQNLIAYSRKKNPHELRYAICKKGLLSHGARGVTYISNRTLFFTGESDGCHDIGIKKKEDEKKHRLVKLLFLPTDIHGKIKRIGNSPNIDRSEQNKLVSLETGFLKRNAFFHAKDPILSKNNQSPAIIMRLAEGNELRAYLHDDKYCLRVFSVDQRINLTIMIAEAIQAQVHRRHIIHRDIKPENIILNTDNNLNPISVVIVDYGLSSDSDDKNNHQSAGTKDYIAPEVCLGNRADEISDCYSFMTMLRIDIWNDISHGKFNGLCDAHKVWILTTILNGVHHEPYARARLGDVIQAFKIIREERMRPAMNEEPAIEINDLVPKL